MGAYTYLFPFEKIQFGSRILIYGAGDVGQAYLKQLLMTKYAEVVAFIDRAWDRYPAMVVPVYSSKEISRLSYDYIVLAFKMGNFAEDVKKNLISSGVDEKKIIFTGARNDDVQIVLPKAEISYLVKDELAYEKSNVSVALKYGPGLGDAIIKKRLFMELSKLAPNAKFDIYAPNGSKYINSIYSDQPNLNIVVDDGGALYAQHHEKYGFSISIFFMIQVNHVKYDVLNKYCPVLADIAHKIEASNEKYGLSIYPATQNWIHFGRAYYMGWNCYNLYNYTGAFDIQDKIVNIPLQSEYKTAFEAMSLGRYVTVNYGNGIATKGNQKLISKQWPKQYFEAYIASIHECISDVKVLQLGDMNAQPLAGADKVILGENLELVKYIMKNSLLHLDIEGGLMHLTTQLGTKCIVLYGSTQENLFSYEQNINIVSEQCKGCYTLYPNTYYCAKGLDEPECMYSISPEFVVAKSVEYLRSL